MIAEMFLGSVWPLPVVQATLCLAAGLALSALFRNSAARAHQVLLTALGAAVLMPGCYTLVKHFQIGVLASEPPSALQPLAEAPVRADAQVIDVLNVEPPCDSVTADDVQPIPQVPVPAEAASAPLPWGRICLGGWIALSTALLARLALQFALGLRLARTARPVESERLHQAAESARARMRIAGPVRIRCSERVTSPIIWCWTRRPVLLIPVEADYVPGNADWVGVFCHELAHLRRRDHASGLFAEILTVLLPWHPLLWWATARLAKLSERACDDWVLAGGHSGVDYAETLLGLAAQRQMAFVPTVIGKEKTMSARIRRIVRDRCGDPRVGAKWAAGIGILAVLAVVTVGFAQPRPAGRGEQGLKVLGEQPGTRESTPRAPDWQRDVLRRKLDELGGQIRDKETLLREAREMPPEERRVQEFELDLLRDMTAQIKRRLRDLERPEPETGYGDTTPDRMRTDVLLQERKELGQARRRTVDEIESLRDDQGAEADELRGRLRKLDEQSRRIDEATADLKQAQPRQERGDLEQRLPMAQERVQTRILRRNDLAKALDNLSRQAGEIERQLASLDNRETDQARDLEAELDRTRMRISKVEEQLRQLERESAGPETGREGGVRGRNAPGDPYGDSYASARGRGRPVPGEDNRITVVYWLKHANPEQIRNILQSLLGESGQTSADERTGSVVVTMAPEKREHISRIIAELDTPTDNRDLRNEVEDLRKQMNDLRDQLRQMHVLLEQNAGRQQTGDPQRQQPRQE